MSKQRYHYNESCATCMKQRNGEMGAMHSQADWATYHPTRFDFDIDMVRRGQVPPGGLFDSSRAVASKDIKETKE